MIQMKRERMMVREWGNKHRKEHHWGEWHTKHTGGQKLEKEGRFHRYKCWWWNRCFQTLSFYPQTVLHWGTGHQALLPFVLCYQLLTSLVTPLSLTEGLSPPCLVLSSVTWLQYPQMTQTYPLNFLLSQSKVTFSLAQPNHLCTWAFSETQQTPATLTSKVPLSDHFLLPFWA